MQMYMKLIQEQADAKRAKNVSVENVIKYLRETIMFYHELYYRPKVRVDPRNVSNECVVDTLISWAKSKNPDIWFETQIARDYLKKFNARVPETA